VGVKFSYHFKRLLTMSDSESKGAKLFGSERAVERVVWTKYPRLQRRRSFSNRRCFGIGNAFCDYTVVNAGGMAGEWGNTSALARLDRGQRREIHHAQIGRSLHIVFVEQASKEDILVMLRCNAAASCRRNEMSLADAYCRARLLAGKRST
jgi:hypothetical protein